ncbi:AAA family ATPase [Microbispora hainanensis]|uniref:AAA family ATPase n=1 Tax=Microbispora hainanensis TaxID=568844 RepID=UPI00386E84EF
MSFTVENYRCFAKPQKVELRPITVVLGRNNSGKSALVRTPLLLQAGIRTTSRSPFDLDQLGDEAPDFRHLVYGSRPHGSIRLGLECASGPADDARSVDVTVQNIDEWQDQVVRQLTVTSGSATTTLTWLDEYELEVNLADAGTGELMERAAADGRLTQSDFEKLGEGIATELRQLLTMLQRII